MLQMNAVIHRLPNTYFLNRDWCVAQPQSLKSLEEMAQPSFLRASPPAWHRWPLKSVSSLPALSHGSLA